MSLLRSSQGAEAVRAAALQAEFNEKKWVWVPDENDGYLAGWVHQEDHETAEIVMASGGEIRHVPLYALSKMNPPKFDRVDDIADITFLNEASVVHNLRLRYGSGAIYTYSGLFLVAINPYHNLPLYTDAIISQYRRKRRDENPPHIFAITERAWVNMGQERENQSILITGESGAGKTESTKKVIQYLSAIATDTHPPHSSHSHSASLASSFPALPPSGLPRSSSFRTKPVHVASNSTGSHFTAKGRLGLLERQILQVNPILEAFGNAKTQQNNNSSRFGKFIRISFAPDGSISGANIDWYLLEKSRVVVRSVAERNFHVFYQLLSSGGSLKDALFLDQPLEEYEFLNKSRREIDGVNDCEDWDALTNALEIVGFTVAEQFDLFRIVAAILHIGNIVIHSSRSGDAVMREPSQAERVCHLLGIPIAEFTTAILRPRALAGREWVTLARTGQQSLDELASLSKSLYERSFGALVERINRALDRPYSKSTFIGVLDIAGFEIFTINTYEQLLINYTNEKLQQFFNHHMFVLEQEEYSREGIEWDYVNFKLDLQPTIDLIESSGNPIGILSFLDEECIMPKATDLTFTEKVHSIWSGEDPGEYPHPGRTKYTLPKFEQGFIITHYAGRVEYRTDGWLEKNKDPLSDNLTRVLASSSEPYVASLFQEFSGVLTNIVQTSGAAFPAAKKPIIKKGAFRTVGQRHKEQLALLMAQLRATQPHFIRCIVPNINKKPGRVDVPLVLDQLRCNGVLEGIRIARLGYPNRLLFVEFRQRYEIMTPGVIPRGYMDGRESCIRIVEALELDPELSRVGASKIFFKAGVLADLEERRDALLYDVFSRLQAVARSFSARRRMKKFLNRIVVIRTIQRNARVYGELQDWPWWQLYTKVKAGKSTMDSNASRRPAQLKNTRRHPGSFFDDTQDGYNMTIEAERELRPSLPHFITAISPNPSSSCDHSFPSDLTSVHRTNGEITGNTSVSSCFETTVTGEQTSQESPSSVLHLLQDLTSHIQRMSNHPITSGGFGDIWKCDLVKSDRTVQVAVKTIRAFESDNAPLIRRNVKRVRRELKIWGRFKHDCILPLWGVADNFGPYPAMICPWVNNGALTSFLGRQQDTLSSQDKFSLLNDIAAGLQYLHSKSIVHGDLTGSNVLVYDDGRACLADFGLSTVILEFIDTSYFTSSIRGNIRWAAAELFEVPEDEEEEAAVSLSTECDVYSFGSITLQVLTCKVPYYNVKKDNVVLGQVIRGKKPEPPKESQIASVHWEFIERCWLPRARRPSIGDIVAFIGSERLGQALVS